MSIPDNTILGKRFKEVREALQIDSQLFFVHNTSVDNSQYGKFEKGAKGLSDDKMNELIDKWNISPKYILTGEGEMFKKEPPPTDDGKREDILTGARVTLQDYINILRDNDAFFKNQYNYLMISLAQLHNQGKNLEALIKLNLEHTGTVEALQKGVEPTDIHEQINNEISNEASK